MICHLACQVNGSRRLSALLPAAVLSDLSRFGASGLTPATALALPPVEDARAFAAALLLLPRQLCTVGSLAAADANADAVPLLCASAASSA